MFMQRHNRAFAFFMLLLATLILSTFALPSLTAAQDDRGAAHKEVIVRAVDEFFNQGVFDNADQFFAADYVQRTSGGDVDLDTFVASIMAERAAMTDYHVAVEIMVAEGDYGQAALSSAASLKMNWR
jgi:hypothetical protein